MIYIFLDVDGVLNNQNHYKKQHKKYKARYCCENMPFNPRSLKNLKRIIKKTDAQIIVSSSWRRSDRAMAVLEARLAEYGIKIKSKTGYNSGNRGLEIKEWLSEYGMKRYIVADNNKIYYPDYVYLIIDDETYDLNKYHDEQNILKLDGRKGLTYFKTLEAIHKLKTIKSYI